MKKLLCFSLILVMLTASVFANDVAFADVSEDVYYYDAVLWAVEQGITGGTSATTFSPNDSCTRSQVVTLLYRFINKQ